jgi:hypothetical protein
VSSTQDRSFAATGQPGAQVERARTSAGAGVVIRDANPLPGKGVTVSGSVNRRSRSSGGVGWISPNPAAVRGSTRVPSHDGATVPSGTDEVAEVEGVGEPGESGELGEAVGVVGGELGEAGVTPGVEPGVGPVETSAGGAAVVPPQALSSTSIATANVALLTSQP